MFFGSGQGLLERPCKFSIKLPTPTKPVDNVVIATKGLQDRTTNITAGTTLENKGKLILIKMPSEIRLAAFSGCPTNNSVFFYFLIF